MPCDVRQSVLALPLRRVAGSRVAGAFGHVLCLAGTPIQRGLSIAIPGTLNAAFCDALWERIRRRASWNLWKDGAWLRWRFCENPHYTYRFITAEDSDGRPAGYLVWSKDPHPWKDLQGAWLMDLEAVDLRTRLALIRRFIQEAASEADYVKAMHTLTGPVGKTLMVSGFVPYRKIPFAVRLHGLGLEGLAPLTSSTLTASAAFADYL